MTFLCPQFASILAQQSEIRFGKAIIGIVIFAPIAMFATKCCFLSNAALAHPSLAKRIGTKNPWVARVACIFGAVICWAMVTFCVLHLLGHA